MKNLMDAIELEQIPKALRMMLLQLADFVEAGMKTAPETKQTSVGEPMLIRVEIPVMRRVMPCCVVDSKVMRKRSWFTICVKMAF